MPQDFKPIFDYLDEMKAELKTDIVAELSPKLDKLQTSVDSFAASYKKTDEEVLTQTHRVDKLENWAKPIGEKLQIPLVQ